jgi:hypothetical protein
MDIKNINNTTQIIPIPPAVPVLAINYPSILFQINDKGVCKGFNQRFFIENKEKNVKINEEYLDIN